MVKNLETKVLLGMMKVKERFAAPLRNKVGAEQEQTSLQKIVGIVALFVGLIFVVAVLTFATGTWTPLWDKIKTHITSFTNLVP